jgi:hypothetical protein
MAHDPDTFPRPPRDALAARLRRLALGVRVLVLLGAPVLVAVPLLQAFAPGWLAPLVGDAAIDPALVRLAQGGITPAVQARMAAVSVLPVAVALALLWQLWGLFGEYRHGAVFSERALRCLGRFASALVVLGLVQPLARALGSVAVSWDNPPGQRQLMVTISSNDYALVLVALVFLAIARVMREAARAAEENEGFV